MNNIKGVPNFIEGITGIGGDLQLKIITSLVIIIILWVTRKGVHRVIVKWTDNIEQRYNWIKTANYIIIVLGAVLVGRVWFQGIQSIATFLGLLSAGLAIALSDVVKSMAGWIYILFEIFSGEAGTLAAKAGNKSLQTAFSAMRIIVTIGWAVYPLGYIFGYLTGGVDVNALNVIYNAADFLNKIAFGLIIWAAAMQNTRVSRS